MESADENLDGSGKGESTNPEQNGFNQKEVKKESIEPEVAIGKDENLEQNGLDKKEVCIEPNAGVQTATQQEKEEEPPHAKRIRLEE
jgi:hypothetical protein